MRIPADCLRAPRLDALAQAPVAFLVAVSGVFVLELAAVEAHAIAYGTLPAVSETAPPIPIEAGLRGLLVEECHISLPSPHVSRVHVDAR